MARWQIIVKTSEATKDQNDNKNKQTNKTKQKQKQNGRRGRWLKNK